MAAPTAEVYSVGTNRSEKANLRKDLNGLVEDLNASELVSATELEATYLRLDDADWIDLTDGGETSLHKHDGRYYTETELDAGQLDNRYYTETELDGGQLDTRYYTETELDSALALKAPLASPTFTGTVALAAVNAGTDTDKFLVLDAGGNVDFRTGAELFSDVGGAPIDSPTFTTSVTIPSTADDATYTGLVTNDSGVLKYRTKEQVLSDIAASPVAGSASIVTVGTIGTGVWQGTVIDSAYIDQSLSVASLVASGDITSGRHFRSSTNRISLGTSAAAGNVLDSHANYTYLKGAIGIRFQVPNGTGLAELTSAGQFKVSTAGSGAGLLLGGDFQIYRSAANVGCTPDGLEVGGNLDIAEYLRHAGDTDTYLRFTSDSVKLYAGGNPIVLGYSGIATYINYDAHHDVAFFSNSASGENRNLYVYGYDTGASAVRYGRMFVGSNGVFYINAQEAAVLGSAAGQSQYFDAGGTFYWRDVDAASAVRMWLNSSTGKLYVSGEHEIGGKLRHGGSYAGFFGTEPITQPVVDDTLASLRTALVNLGLVDFCM